MRRTYTNVQGGSRDRVRNSLALKTLWNTAYNVFEEETKHVKLDPYAVVRFVKYEKQNISNAFESFEIANYRSPTDLRLNATTPWESRQSPRKKGFKTLQSRSKDLFTSSYSVTSQIQIIIIDYPVKGKSITGKYDVNGLQHSSNKVKQNVYVKNKKFIFTETIHQYICQSLQ